MNGAPRPSFREEAAVGHTAVWRVGLPFSQRPGRLCLLSEETGLLARHDLPRHRKSGVAAVGTSDGRRVCSEAIATGVDLVLEPGDAIAIGGRIEIDLAAAGCHQGQ